MGYRGKVAEQQRARDLRAQAWTLQDIAGEQLSGLSGALSMDTELSVILHEDGLELIQEGSTTIKDGKLKQEDADKFFCHCHCF